MQNTSQTIESPMQPRWRSTSSLRVASAAVLLLVALVSREAASQTDPPVLRREFRAAWIASVANIDWPSRPGLTSWQQQAELRAMLDRAVDLNLNAVMLQVRPAADALYASPYEPWSAYLTGLEGRAPEPYYDPLTFAVREAHARGLELHAWFNPYRARHPSAKGPAAQTHISTTHPALVRRYGAYLWMDPGEPAVIRRTLRVMLDVVKRYDVDGIHIDDYFYPYPETGADGVEIQFPDSSSYAAYQRKGGRLERDDWRRHSVDTLVQQLYARTKAMKPWVKVGISPFGIWRPGNPEQIKGFDSYAKLYGDSRRWLREGWIDYFTPQLYWPIAQTPQSYPVLLDWWISENVRGRHMWPGHNASRAAAGGSWAPGELNAQVLATRASAATGDVHFSMRALMPLSALKRDSVLVGVATPPPSPGAAAALADQLKSELYQARALIPASPWLSSKPTARPRIRVRTDPGSGEWMLRIVPSAKVAWWTVRVLTDSGWRTWILPGAQTELAVATAGVQAPARVIVTAVDRYGTESTPATIPLR